MAESTDISALAPDARGIISDTLNGKSMQRLSIQRQSALMDLRNSGRLKAATVINFNPVSLVVENQHVPWRVPSMVDKLRKRLRIEHGGKEYEAAVLTVREPAFVPWLRDVRPPSDDSGNPVSEFDPVFIMPVELVDQYRITYVDPVGQMQMGGVLVFEGDVHAFTKSKTIRVPRYTVLPDRKRSYYTQEVDAAKELTSVLAMQKEYCQGMLQQADEYDQDEVQRRNITPVHRLWAQYALDMGWKQTSPEWMTAQLDSEESCKGCGKGKKRTDAWFCDCGRPYNPYAAFMAGENVPESYLFALKGSELEDVLKELGRREQLRAQFRPKAT